MSPIGGTGGPGGIGGPKGPSGPGPTDELDELGDVADVTETARAGELDAIASDLAAGKLTAREAVDRLVDQIAGTEDLGPGERAELREMMQDLVANDPYLSGLLNRS